MSGGERQALASWLARPSLERLWTAARAKLEHYGALRGSACVEDPDASECRAVANLLGRRTVPAAGRPLRVRLVELDRTLRASRFAVGLEEALAQHHGALRNLPAEKAASEERWRRFWRAARRHPLVLEQAGLGEWLADVESTGLYRRLAEKGSEDIGDLLERVLAVLGVILSGEAAGIRLAVLASRALGDSHALDPGHRVPALVLRALARLHQREIPTTAAARRDLWARGGVVCDDLSCDVLVLGLAPAGDDLLHRFARRYAAAGEPLRLTLRQLARSEPVRLAPGPVFVCENPAVVSVAADRLGRLSPPLVCLAGQPDTAARVLLESLAEGGAELRYHGDFDWGGVRIANALSRMVAFTPWRFTAADYRQAAALAGGAELGDHPVDAEWDRELRPAMEEKGLVVEEEAVIGDLLGDLERASCGR